MNVTAGNSTRLEWVNQKLKIPATENVRIVMEQALGNLANSLVFFVRRVPCSVNIALERLSHKFKLQWGQSMGGPIADIRCYIEYHIV